MNIETTTTDEMFQRDVDNAELVVFQFKGHTLTVEGLNDVGIARQLEEGGFYKVVADVTYLNGGVAGYVNYPEIKSVQSCEPVSPYDLGLPSIDEKPYGLVLIGGYADGDVLLNGQANMGVWKDGSWVYSYDRAIRLPDGRMADVRSSVSEDDVLAGVGKGILSCEDYFVLPA